MHAHLNTSGGRYRSDRDHVNELQFARLLSATVTAVTHAGVEATTVARIINIAGVSRKTFYDFFKNRDDCVRAVIEDAVRIASERAEQACRDETRWVDRVRAVLFSLLELLDEQPPLAQLLVVHAATTEPAVLESRTLALKRLATLIDSAGHEQATQPPSPLTADALVAGALGVTHARLTSRKPAKLTQLLQPLMSYIVMPYRGAGAARKELHRPAPPATPARARQENHQTLQLAQLDTRLTYRTMRVLAALAAQPGASNGQTAQRAGISDNGQISRLLYRLARQGLVENHGKGQSAGGCNAWHLTALGERLETAVGREFLNARR
jgi:AcrR family transcriptional regulator/DNA-binding MarR family transcriptional regulator